MTSDNRETWLNKAVDAMRTEIFEPAYGIIPAKVRVAIAFPSTGRKGKRIGECWSDRASSDGTFEIMLRPDMDDPIMLLATLAHELVHATVGLKANHGKMFKRLALDVGLEGKMTATVPGEAFRIYAAGLAEGLGPLPHARLNFKGETTAPKKQTTRQLKVSCPDCGYLARVTRKWLVDMGPPICPAHGVMIADEAGEADV
jgi:hypothetical protein